MPNPLAYTVTFQIHPNAIDEFRALANEAVSITQDEPATIDYRWFLSADGGRCTIHEQFPDSNAMVTHLEGPAATTVLPKLLDHADLAGIEVYGDPSPEARKILDGLGATYCAPFAGFSRMAPEKMAHAVLG